MFALDPRDINPSFVEQSSGVFQKALLAGYGTLAPSSHNTQPWRFRISPDGIDVMADRSRALPVVDPDDRELVISCGAALEGIVIAARCFGLIASVRQCIRPEDPDHLARIQILTSDPATHGEVSLFHAIRNRRTTRMSFEDYVPSDKMLAECAAIARDFGVTFSVIRDTASRARIANLVARGDEIQFHDPAFRKELAQWVHSASLGSRDGMSGAGFGMPDILAGAARFAIRTFDMGKGISAKDRDKITGGSPVLAIFATENDDPAAWLATGRALMRTLADLTGHGLTASYLNQPIEVAELRPQLRTVAGVEETPQLLIRIGRCSETPQPSARRFISDVIEFTDQR